MGYSDEELLITTYHGVTHPEDQDIGSGEGLDLDANGLMTFEKRYLTRDGSTRQVTVNAVLIRGQDNQPQYWITQAIDISKQRQAEERLRTVINSAPVILSMIDRTGTITISEGQGLNLLGLQPGERVGKNVFEEYRDNPDMMSCFRRAVSGEEFTIVTPLWGRALEQRFTPIRDGRGLIDGGVIVATDVTEREMADRAQRESEARFRAVFEQGPVAMTIEGLDEEYIETNKAFQHLVGYSPEQLATMTWRQLTHPDDLHIGSAAGLDLGSIGVRVYEKRYVRADGVTKWVAINNAVIRDDEGQPQYWIDQILDVTDQKEAEEALRSVNAI